MCKGRWHGECRDGGIEKIKALEIELSEKRLLLAEKLSPKVTDEVKQKLNRFKTTPHP